jgi:hypothetical protein
LDPALTDVDLKQVPWPLQAASAGIVEAALNTAAARRPAISVFFISFLSIYTNRVVMIWTRVRIIFTRLPVFG